MMENLRRVQGLAIRENIMAGSLNKSPGSRNRECLLIPL